MEVALEPPQTSLPSALPAAEAPPRAQSKKPSVSSTSLAAMTAPLPMPRTVHTFEPVSLRPPEALSPLRGLKGRADQATANSGRARGAPS